VTLHIPFKDIFMPFLAIKSITDTLSLNLAMLFTELFAGLPGMRSAKNQFNYRTAFMACVCYGGATNGAVILVCEF